MSRAQRTKQFRDNIEEIYFNEIMDYVRKYSHKKNIDRLYLNYRKLCDEIVFSLRKEYDSIFTMVPPLEHDIYYIYDFIITNPIFGSNPIDNKPELKPIENITYILYYNFKNWYNGKIKKQKKKKFIKKIDLDMYIQDKKINSVDYYLEKIKAQQEIVLLLLEKFPDKDRDYSEFSRNPYLTLGWLVKFPDKDWDWGFLSRDSNLTLGWLEKFPDKDWDWKFLSRNSNLTLGWLEKFPDKDWDYSDIYFSVKNVYERKLREYLAAYKIQQWWYMITMSPHYKIGRKFIDRKYSELYK